MNKRNFFRQTVIYQRGNRQIRRESGYFQPQEKEIYRLPASRIVLEPGENIFSVQATSHFPLTPEFQTLSPDKMKNLILREQFILGFIFAIILSMTLYNLLLFIVLRQKSHLFYVLYLLTTLFFLQVRQHHPRIYRGLLAALFLILALFLITLTRPFMAMSLYQTFLMLTPLFFIGIGLYIFLRGYRPAGYFTLAYGLLVVSSVFFNLTIQNFIPWTLLGEWSYYFGICAEMILLSLALGDRQRLTEQTLLAEQAEYIQRLEVEEREKQHVYRQLSKVVYQHQIRLIRDGRILEETMPSQKKEALVIALDIVNSSTLEHQTARRLFNQFFSRCYGLMREGYDGQKMEAAAYRIKEMGDGFLCSLGFPFAVPEGYTNEEMLLRLTEGFLSEFDITTEELGITGRVFCSLGAALGDVEAYYPRGGTKEYDLYGAGIILAARYEGLRKKLFPRKSISSHLFFVQTALYERLPVAAQKDFEAYSLKSCPLEEDPEATSVHLRRIP